MIALFLSNIPAAPSYAVWSDFSEIEINAGTPIIDPF
jgi:hypothetical protein